MSSGKRKRLAWRKEQKELYAMRQTGADLTYGGEEAMVVRDGRDQGWFFVTGTVVQKLGVKSFNSLWGAERYVTIEEAKEAAKAYFLKLLEGQG